MTNSDQIFLSKALIFLFIKHCVINLICSVQHILSKYRHLSFQTSWFFPGAFLNRVLQPLLCCEEDSGDVPPQGVTNTYCPSAVPPQAQAAMLTAMAADTTASSVQRNGGVTTHPQSLPVFGEHTLNDPSHAIPGFTPLLSLPSRSPTLILAEDLRSSPEKASLGGAGLECVHCSRASLLTAGCGNESKNHHHKPAEEPQTPFMQPVSGHVRKSCYCQYHSGNIRGSE